MDFNSKNKRKIEYHKLQIWYLMRAEEIKKELSVAAKDAYVHANKKTAIAFIDGGDYVDEGGACFKPLIKQLRKDKYILYFERIESPTH